MDPLVGLARAYNARGGLGGFPVDGPVTELQRRGRFRTAYEGTTLRENFGPRPHVNRYVAEREERRLASD